MLGASTMTNDPRTPTDILADSETLYEEKNDDYGDSWRLVGKTLALWARELGAEEELTIPTNEHALGSLGLFTRRLDKLIRQFNGWFMAEEFAVDESLAETHADSVPYAAMHASLAEAYVGMEYEGFADGDDA